MLDWTIIGIGSYGEESNILKVDTHPVNLREKVNQQPVSKPEVLSVP